MTSHVRTVTFIDLAGFTTATAAHGDETAADLADRLVELTNRSLGPDDQLVKGIGDAVMLVSDTPADALALAGRICHLADHEPAFPLLRIGLHHGPVVERNHDWFGNTVNIAARLASRAEPGQVLGSTNVTEAATRAGMDVTDLGPTHLRGAPNPVTLHAITPCPAEPNRAIDPVCKMAVDPARAAATRARDDTSYTFCSTACADLFDVEGIMR